MDDLEKKTAQEVPVQEQQNNGGISKEKLQWMQKIGFEEFKEPMKYHVNGYCLYSEKYIKDTPLDELKRKCAKTMYADKLKSELHYKTFKFFYIFKKFFKVVFKTVFHVDNCRIR